MLWAIILIVVAIPVIVFKPEWAFLCRASLLGLGCMYLLPLLIWTPSRGLVIGAYDIETKTAGFTVGLLLFLAGWAITSTSDLILDAGAVRMNQTLPIVSVHLHSVRSTYIVIAVLLNWGTIYIAREGLVVPNFGKAHVVETLLILMSVFVGLLAGFVLYAVIRCFRAPTKSLTEATRAPLHRLIHKREKDHEFRLLDEARESPDFKHWTKFPVTFLGSPVPYWLGRGYLKESAASPRLFKSILQPHVYAFLGFAVVFVAYLVIFLWCRFWYRGSAPPSLSSLLLLLILCIWFFSAATFFLDAYKIPVSLVVLLIVIIASGIGYAGHYYDLHANPDAPPIRAETERKTRPSEVLSQPLEVGKPAVLICAAGGGIQAAAWTAKVLTGLEEELDKGNGAGTFAKSIRLFSGVSGGSVGIMYYAHATYPVNSSLPDPIERRKSIVQAAEDSSLDPAVFGLAYYDLWRLFWPFEWPKIGRDRAWELEDAWVRNGKRAFASTHSKSLSGATLFAWRRDAATGVRPAVIFNATTVESGEHMMFSTSPLQNNLSSERKIRPFQRDFFSVHPDCDVSIPDVVRLSATFPVVSPAARPNPSVAAEDRYDLVDGGYYDNSGLTALSFWLDDALQDLYAHPRITFPKRILVIQIQPFPEHSARSGDDKTTAQNRFGELLAPALAVLQVRDHVQIAMADGSFDGMAKRWELEAHNPIYVLHDRPVVSIQLESVRFTPESKDDITPLSWHLRQGEVDQIDKSWQDFKISGVMKDIRNFFDNVNNK